MTPTTDMTEHDTVPAEPRKAVRRLRALRWIVPAAALLLLGSWAMSQSSTGPAEPEVAEPAAIETDIHPGTAEDDFVGALVDVTELDCTGDGAAWRAQGLVTNPTAAAASYRIYVSFLAEDGDTRGLVQVDVEDVEAGATEEWGTSMAIDGDDLRCVLRVERTEAGSVAASGER